MQATARLECASAVHAHPRRVASIRAICVTSNNVSDAAVIADLLHQLPKDEVLNSLTGDGAYDMQPVYEALMERGAIPIIPPRKNARIRKGQAFAHRNKDELHQTIG